MDVPGGPRFAETFEEAYGHLREEAPPATEGTQPRIRVDVYGLARLSNSFDGEDSGDTLRRIAEKTSINDIRAMCKARRLPIQLNTGGPKVRAKSATKSSAWGDTISRQ